MNHYTSNIDEPFVYLILSIDYFNIRILWAYAIPIKYRISKACLRSIDIE